MLLRHHVGGKEMKKPSLKERLSYRIDCVMSKGTTSLIILLGFVTLIIVLLAGFAVILWERSWAGGSWIYGVWKSFTLTLDPGNLAGVEGSIGLIFIATVSTISGIFITSSLIGILNTGLSNHLEELRRGNSRILEKNHTVILGFNESVFTILEELLLANENKKKACIVLLSHLDKQEVEELIERRIPYRNNTRIICRNGDITSAHDLRRCSIESSKSVIINLTEDFEVIRAILAVTNYLRDEQIQEEYPESRNIHIAASINKQENLSVARIAGQGYAEVLHFNQIISRIMAHICFQPGLSSVYLDLFDFRGDEIYMEYFPGLEGRTFQDLQLSFDHSTVIGIKRGQEAFLNPDPMLCLQKEDELILIAADDAVSVPRIQLPEIQDMEEPPEGRNHRTKPGNLLILGTNELLMDILRELDDFLPEHTQVTVASKYSHELLHPGEEVPVFKNLEIDSLQMTITNRANLHRLLERNYQHILILSDSRLSREEADAKTISLLLQIREWGKAQNKEFSITTEMLSSRNQELAQVADVSDFVVSSNIVGLMMSQVAENRLLAPIFSELLDSVGSEIYLKPASRYVPWGKPVDLFTLTSVVSQHQEVFLGYKIRENDGKGKSKIILNPNKNTVVSFREDEWLIVLAKS